MERVNSAFSGGGVGAGLLFSDLRLIPRDADVAGDVTGLVTDVDDGDALCDPGLNGGGAGALHFLRRPPGVNRLLPELCIDGERVTSTSALVVTSRPLFLEEPLGLGPSEAELSPDGARSICGDLDTEAGGGAGSSAINFSDLLAGEL